MCIVFIYNGNSDPESEYSLILITNRDEFFDRHAQNMTPWKEDPNVYGGIDLGAECQSTWLAYSSSKKKLGLLLNYPEVKKENPKSRGKLVAEYIKSDHTANNYVELIRNYGGDCDGFIFVTVEFGKQQPLVQTYSNATNKLQTWTKPFLGFSNNLPNYPLTKVESGKESLKNICEKYKTIERKSQLIDTLLELLKSEERHIPDPILQKRRPDDYQWFSSIYVCVPPVRYGTRTHTLMLVTKAGHGDLIEITMQSPINISNPVWKRSDFHFKV